MSRSPRGSWQGRGGQPAAVVADRQQRARQVQARSYKFGRRAVIPVKSRAAGLARREQDERIACVEEEGRPEVPELSSPGEGQLEGMPAVPDAD